MNLRSEFAMAAPSSCWEAELKLGFASRGGRTVLADRIHKGPLTVQRPFYPEGEVCHVYVLHPPGGVVSGDSLRIEANVAAGAHGLMTTPGAGKFYRSGGAAALQNVSLQVHANASLEWLPQESIVYEGARLHSSVTIDLEKGARFIGWEVLSLGRPAAGEGFAHGEACLNWQINLAGSLFYLERLRLDAQAFEANWGLQGHAALATLFAYPCDPQLLSAVQALIAESSDKGVTQMDELLICRAMNTRADQLRKFFEQVRAILRPNILGKADYSPRIWAT